MPASPPMPQGRRQIDYRQASGVLAESWDCTVTMGQVGARLGLAKPTLYRLAGTKAALVRACTDAEGERLIGWLDAELAAANAVEPRAVVAAALRAVDRFASDSPGGFELLIERRGDDARRALERVEGHLGELLGRAASRPAAQSGPPELQAAALLGAVTAVVSRSRAAGRRLDAEAVAAALQVAFAGGD